MPQFQADPFLYCKNQNADQNQINPERPGKPMLAVPVILDILR